MKFRQVFSYGWKVALGIVLFAYVASSMDWGNVYAKFREVQPQYFVAGTAIVLLQAVVLGWRWQRIARIDCVNIKLRQYVTATLIGFFFSQGLPASLGADAFRIWWYARRGVAPTKGLKIVAFDRIIGLASLAAVCGASIAVFVVRVGNKAAVNSLVAIVVIAFIGFALLVLPFKTGLTRRVLQIAEKLPPVVARIVFWLIDLHQLFRAGSPAEITLIATLGIAIHLMTVLLGYVLATALGSGIDFLGCLAVIAPALLISYIPISIAGWGVREAALVFAFGLIGVAPETALLISLGIGVIVLIVSLFGGVLWALSGMRRMYLDASRHEGGT